MRVVLDASAVLAALNDEPGAERVAPLLDNAVICPVNLSEVAAALLRNNNRPTQVRAILDELGLPLSEIDEEMAVDAGLLRPATDAAGLSLGDRYCLATARRLGAPAITADQAWRSIAEAAQVKVQVIR